MSDVVKAADSFPLLPRVYKGKFPFALACPSFIYPADYLPNVRRLGLYLDEIELLFLEGSSRRSLPDTKLIRELTSVAGPLGLTYNVHLPTDVSLTANHAAERDQAAAAIARALDRVQPLDPTACVLHLPWQGETEVRGRKTEARGEEAEDNAGKDPCVCPLAEVRGKQEFLDLGAQGLDLLKGKGADQERLVLENLETYPLEWVEEILDETGLGLCLDLGHLLLQGADLREAFQRNRSRIRIMHLHGFEARDGRMRDHCGLHRLRSEHLPVIKHILEAFEGVVCLEVFNFQDLSASLAVLEELLV
ncbi:MAG: TIM barrel protein [Desulfohalobiaceae bacterium]|nr:TIM barrel protein [Desulfohalobiaceae bacterium]